MKVRSVVMLAVALVLVGAPARAELDRAVLKVAESKLKPVFEGSEVRIKLDMPATSQGVDLNIGDSQPLDFEKHSHRLKSTGIALKKGESVMVTKVKVNGKFIEFQLAGGGYGTFGDDTDPDVGVPSAEKTRREKDLENWIRGEPNAEKKRELQRELDDLRKARAREDAANRATAAAATEAQRALIADKRRSGGSRFNVRWANGVPEAALTPDGLRHALARWVEFGDASDASVSGGSATPPAGGFAALRKGMTIDDVERALGRPEQLESAVEGGLKKTTCTYASGDGKIDATFVEGLLVRYSFRSN